MANIFSRLFTKSEAFDLPHALEGLEESLIVADAGLETSQEIVNTLKKGRINSHSDLKANLTESLTRLFSALPVLSDLKTRSGLTVIMMLGVNGTGKTTTLAKLANLLKSNGKKVLVAAGDTFRAAAIEQLEEWCMRIDVPIIKQKQFSDSSAVIYDAITSGLAQGFDYVLVDTAGRMHTNADLMRELDKIDKTILKKISEKSLIRLMAIDSQTGQNSFLQVQKFSSLFPIHGIILTKVDSGFKAGIALRIASELHIPILYRTTGEQISDIVDFKTSEYIQSLF